MKALHLQGLSNTLLSFAQAAGLTALLLFSTFSVGAQVVSPQTAPMLRTLPLNLGQLAAMLSAAPPESSLAAKTNPLLLDLPMPGGGERTFRVVESPIMEKKFAAAYPDFKTYAVQAADDPAVTGRISWTPFGVNGVILSHEGMILIRPLDLLNPVLHEVSLNAFSAEAFICDTQAELLGENAEGNAKSFSNGGTKRTYSLAIVCTGEFHNGNGGTVPAATAVVTASVNGIQAIYERELAVNFTLLTPFVYTDPNTDPFNPGLSRTLEAAQAVEANFPGGNYDMGHVFHDSNEPPGGLGGGGVAGLGVVCSNFPEGTGFWKGRGWSGNSDNTTADWISLAAHEFGHMFNMPHSFNGTGGSCTSNISPDFSYEIGSGSTIMSYNGICQANNNIPSGGTADHYFHANSLDRAVNYMMVESCHDATATGNSPPVVNANPCGGAYTIPVGTPFRLTGSGTDADGDQIYYCWEQYDEDGAGSTATQGFIGATAAASPIAPLFRSYPPTTSPSRTFPNMSLVAANNYASSFEPLPTVARTLNFRLTGRDWKMGGGGIHCSPIAVTVSASGPLTVTAPNGGETLTAGSNTTVTWSVNGTNAFCNNVNIRLSADGGITYPYYLVSSTPNDGSQSVTIPAGVTNTTAARIMVECADNTCVVFFDISNNNFTVTSDCNAARSNICPVTPVSFPAGDGGLNLGLTRFYGNEISSHTVNVTAADPEAPRAVATIENGSVCTTVGTRDYKSFDIAVSATGIYTLNVTSSGFCVVSVFSSAGFNANSPCSSNFFGSNGWDDGGGGANIKSSFNTTMNLSACTLYKVMVYVSSNGFGDNTVSFSGPGQVYLSGADPGANYSYTYLAVNNANNQVAAVSATSDFTALAVGSYLVYGASYYSGAGPNPPTVNPATWVGQTLSAILSGGSCVVFSDNTKPVTVTGGGGGTPVISISGNPSQNEGNAGNTAFNFTAIRTGSTANASSANWAVTGSGANPANAADFGGTLPSGTVTFPAGSSASQTITVNVSGDTSVEPNEGFTVTLSNPVNATIGTATASGTILNDDTPPAYCTAGAGSTSYEKISRVQFNTIDNMSSSTAGYEDFTAVSTLVVQGATHNFTGTISSGFQTDEIIVWIDFNQDYDFADAGEEVFNSPTGVGPHSGNITISASASLGNTRMRVRLHDTVDGPNATPCGNSSFGQVEDYTINITAGGGTPSIAISGSPSQNEGNAGNTAFNFTVTRTGNNANASSATWAVTGSGGNPANAADFGGTLPSGTVTFPAGSSATQTITVNVSGDTGVEPDEGFTVTLSNPMNATITTATASGTIVNDDASIAISGSPSQNEGNAGNTAFNFTATRTGSTANASSASWAVTGSGGNPANAADFGGTLPSGMVTFPAGSSASQTITVNVSGDTGVEPDEGFTVTLSNPMNATITTATASGTIVNDDAAANYCTAGANSTEFEKISNVQFNTINNNSNSTAGDEDFTAVSTSVAQGATHNFTATINGGYPSDEIIVWIDFNQDFDFADPGEEVFNSPTGAGPHSGNITIPANATTGNTRMRVRLHDTDNGPNAAPCGNAGYGQVEDYTINITTAGPVGASLDFDGTNDHVTLPANLTASLTNFTLEAWVFWDGSSNWQRIFDFGNNTTVYMQLTPSSGANSSKPMFAITTGSNGAEQRINSSVSAAIGQWQHYAVVLDDAANTGILYIDGVQVGSNTNMTLTPAALGNLANNYLGRSNWPDPYFDGKMDEVRIWNYARTPQQIQCEMDAALIGNETGLVAYYNFNQGVGNGTNTGLTTLDDLTANNSDGTLVNFALTGTSSNWSPATGSGKVLDFVDGDYVTGANALLPVGNSARTIECWLKSAPASSGYEVFFNYGTAVNSQRASLGISPGGKLLFSGEFNDLEGTSSIRDGVWHHCAATFDGTTLRVYVDGNLENSTGTTYNTTGTTFDIGRKIGQNGEFLDGKLDELRVWNVARTQDQIRAFKSMQLSGTESGLVAYYNFNQGIANGNNAGLTVLDDRSPTNADGTLTGFALTGNASNWSGPGALTDAPGLGCCPTNLYVNGIITSGTYQAMAEVNSDGTIPAGANVTFKGANSIVLQPNFTVTLGAVFTTLLQACTP